MDFVLDEEYQHCMGLVNVLTGYAVMCLNNMCFVWSYDKVSRLLKNIDDEKLF
jgi:hypothetical protein